MNIAVQKKTLARGHNAPLASINQLKQATNQPPTANRPPRLLPQQGPTRPTTREVRRHPVNNTTYGNSKPAASNTPPMPHAQALSPAWPAGGRRVAGAWGTYFIRKVPSTKITRTTKRGLEVGLDFCNALLDVALHLLKCC